VVNDALEEAIIINQNRPVNAEQTGPSGNTDELYSVVIDSNLSPGNLLFCGFSSSFGRMAVRA
jgi:hypothetical protein